MAEGEFDFDLGSGSPSPPGAVTHSARDEIIGFSLTFVASLGICFSLNLQKLVHVRNVDPTTGQASVSFLTLPLWWVGCLSNAAAELLNLAALGYAPATLVTPLGCLTVVFNCVSSAIFLKEQFLRRDVLGILFIGAGVVCVVWSQVGSPASPITPHSLRYEVLPSTSFWILVGIVIGGLLFIYVFLHERYRLRTCWIFLGESSLVSTFTVVSARCFASFLPYPMPGQARYFYTSPDCWLTWGSLILLAMTAVGGLLLQNAALMHFKASEVVPIYFCMFALSGVAGSGLAFGELRMPWVLMLIPGVLLCILGVFSISHRREERIAKRLSLMQPSPPEYVGSALYEPPPPATPQAGGHAPPLTPLGALTDVAASRAFVGLERGLPQHAASAGPGRLGPGMGRASAPSGGMPTSGMAAPVDDLSHELSRGVTGISEACSVASATSVASHFEESAFCALGGGAMSLSSTIRMARAARVSAEGMPVLSPAGSLGSPGSAAGSLGSSSSLARVDPAAADSVRRCLGRAVDSEQGGSSGVSEALLPRCSGEAVRATAQHPSSDNG